MKTANKNYPYYNHIYYQNLQEMILENYNNIPNKVAFSFFNGDELVKKTYKDVYEDVFALSNYFYNMYNNKHIGLIGENSYNWIITFFSIILSGNVCVPYDKDIDNELLTKQIKLSGTKAIYYSRTYNEGINKLKIKSYPLEDISSYMKLYSKKNNKYKIDNDKDAAIFWTSGTTGFNKGVLLSQKNIMSNIYGACSLFKPSGRIVSLLPFNHTFGLITSVLKPFNYGKEVFINNSLRYVMRDLKEIAPETIFVVPLFVENFYKQIWKNARKKNKEVLLRNNIKLSNFMLSIGIDMRKKLFKSILKEFGGELKYIICGGAYLNQTYIDWFHSIGIEILNGYGITECSPVVSVNRNFYKRSNSVGVPIRGLEVKIIDKEICIKGPSVMKGYYNDKKSTKAVFINDYFKTGDLGYIDKDGFIYITGRKKNIIILNNGENISPEEIETELLKDDGVREVIVYEKDNKIIAKIFPEEEYLKDQDYFDKLMYDYNINKPKNKQITMVLLEDKELPKNNNGKIIRTKAIGEE